MRRSTGGTNLGLARNFNRRVVLETIRLHGPMSKADVARETALSVQTVSNIAEELTASGLLRVQGRRQGTRGAPALDLAIDPDGGFTFGISLDHQRLVCVLVDIAGQKRDQAVLDIAGMEPDGIIGLTEHAVRRLANAEGANPDRIWGAGGVMPMLFEHGRPVVFGPTSMPAWQHYPIVERLGRALETSVVVENDATAAAVGEHLYGVGRRLRDFFYIYVGVGVGGGMILSGHPYRGTGGRAGELGHVVVVPGGRPCACGNRGCLERYASLSAAHSVLDGTPEEAAAVEPADLAASADRLGGWMDDAAAHLATACMMIANVLDPEAIVVGGIVPEPLLSGLIARMQTSLAAANIRPAILRAEVDLETPALGGAALPLLEGLSPTISLLFKPTQGSWKKRGTSPARLTPVACRE